MSDNALHIAGEMLARAARGNLAAGGEEGRIFHEHLRRCASCQARYERMKGIVARMPKMDSVPMFYPELDEVCEWARQLEHYEDLPVIEMLMVWSHIVFGHCPECAGIAQGMGGAFNWELDPFTEDLVKRLGSLAPRTRTPRFAVSMAGPAAPQAGRSEAMNASVMLSTSPKKRQFDLTVYRTPPKEPDGFWHLRIKFAAGTKLPKGFSMYLYEEGWPNKPLRSSTTDELEMDIAPGVYRLNLDNQDQILVPLLPDTP